VTLIADTGGLYALFDADDVHHVAVRRVLEEEAVPCLVPGIVLGELDYLLREWLGVEAELSFLDDLISGAFVLEPTTMEDLTRARGLEAQYRDLDLGLVDAAVMATAERLKSDRILTVDVRDFRAVVPRSGRPFVLLPADLS